MRYPTTSLRTYLIAVILLATLPIAALMAAQIVTDVNEQRQRMRESLQQNASSIARSVEREIASSVDALTILSYADPLQQGNLERFRALLGERPLLRNSWGSVYLATLDGQVLFDTRQRGPPPGDERIEAMPSFRKILSGSQRAMSNLVRDPVDGRPVTTIQVGVHVDSDLRYVLGAWIEARVWQELIDKTAPGGGFTSIFDADYTLIARTRAPEASVGLPMPTATMATMQGRRSGNHRTSLLEGGHAYEAWDTVSFGDWGVSAAVPAAPYDAAHRKAVVAALGTAGASLAAGLLLALLAARGVTRPLRQLATTGTSRPFRNIAVREVAMLRDALFSAHTQDQAVRERLQAKADEFETLFDSSPIGMAFAQDRDSRVVMHNAAMDRLVGPPHLMADGSVRILHRGLPVPFPEMPLQRAATRGETTTSLELEILPKGKPSVFVLASAVPLRDGDGNPRGAIGALIDITERKLTEARLISVDQRLRESQRLVDLAQEAGHVGFFHYLFGTDVLSWTPGQAKLFGMTTVTPEATLDDWAQRVAAEDRGRIEATLGAMLEERQQKETIEFKVGLPDGSWRWLSSRVLVSYGSDHRPQQMVGITVDITDQKEAERERAALVEREQAARLEAEAANRSKDEFLAMLGHELRNPLSAISSAVEVLNRVEATAPVAVQARNIIARQTRRLADMMEDLLDVARVISGKVPLTQQPVDLSALVRRTVATLQMIGATERHSLDLELDEVWIDADATRIEQVVTNLLTNALKYTPAGGRVRVDLGAQDGVARLQVQDNGDGIPPGLLPRIFDLFVQGERPLDRGSGGLGIGLTLARRLVELHGGTISVDSGPAGSCFTIRLQAIERPQARAEPPARQPPSALQIVVIEDNDDVLHALRTTLELDGNQVATETNGARGLEMLLDRRPDAAIVDIGLPELTGYEVARRSRAAGFAGRMIAISGYGQAQDVRKALAAGFDAHLVKPIDIDALHRLLTD